MGCSVAVASLFAQMQLRPYASREANFLKALVDVQARGSPHRAWCRGVWPVPRAVTAAWDGWRSSSALLGFQRAGLEPARQRDCAYVGSTMRETV